MHLDKLTDAARGAVERAFARGAELRHTSIEPEHLLLALLEDENGPAVEIVRQLQGDPKKIRDKLETHLATLPTADHVAPSDQYVSRPLTAVIDAAETEAAKRKDRYTSVEQLLVGIASTKSEAREILEDAGVRRAGIVEALKALRGPQAPVESRQDEAQFKALEKYSR
ncbi:MAG TPA: Clp protease N-terminal domain-containing protein, partial [Thermoplasmata archaeon]|nr:Clp protease N-terminal domain-containing protein [Thermoplasmata archaeon]